MTTPEAIQAVYLKATGKTTTLSSGTKYDKILGLLKFYQRRWGREPGVDWGTLYNPALSIGNVTATDSFDIDTSTIRVLSMTEGDTVKIMWTNGLGYTEYDIIAPDSMKDYFYGQNKESSLGRYCARIGDQLTFNHTFTSADPEFGGDIQIPCYTYPEEITGSDDEEIQVDDPDWLVLRCAAEYVRTDLIRKNEYSNLLSEANEAMTRMIDDNGSQIDEVIRPWTPFAG
jgi:hypothetical protein